MSAFFAELSRHNRSRTNATLLALNYQSQNALSQMMRNKSVKEVIHSFYSRQAIGLPPIPNYLENSIYSQLVHNQHSLYLQARDPDRMIDVKQNITEAATSDSDEEEYDWQQLFAMRGRRYLPKTRSELASSNKNIKNETPTDEEFEALRSLLSTDLTKLTITTQDLRLPTEWDTVAKGEQIDISVDRLKLTYKGE